MTTPDRATRGPGSRVTALLLPILVLAAMPAAAAAGAELRAGLGVATLPHPEGGPLGGYGGIRDRRAEGVLDPPEARALVLDRDELRIGLLTLDVVIARPELRDAVLERVQPLGIDALVLVATHTHSGPGGYIPGFLPERFTAGGHRAAAAPEIADAAASALEAAVASLAPARAASQTAKLDLARNRRVDDGPRETGLPVLRLDRSGFRPVVVFAYGMHPTALSRESRLYSADYAGAARAWLEERGYEAVYLPGPLGDQRPPASPESVSEVDHSRALGAALGSRVLETAEALRPARGADLDAIERWVELPEVRLRRFCGLWWLGPLVRGSVRQFLSDRVPIHALRVGRARIIAVPGEPSSAVGAAVRARVPDGATPFVVAHANDWMGYVVGAEAYRRGGYEACLSFHGEGAGAWLASQAGETLELMEAQ